MSVEEACGANFLSLKNRHMNHIQRAHDCALHFIIFIQMYEAFG